MGDRTSTVYSVIGTLLWITGLIMWGFTRDADAVPYMAMFTSIACVSWGSAFVGTLPLWKRIARLDEQIKILKAEGDK